MQTQNSNNTQDLTDFCKSSKRLGEMEEELKQIRFALSMAKTQICQLEKDRAADQKELAVLRANVLVPDPNPELAQIPAWLKQAQDQYQEPVKKRRNGAGKAK